MNLNLLFTGDFVIQKWNREDILSEELKEVFKNNDINCINLEGPIIDENSKAKIKIGPNIYNDRDATKNLIEDGANLFCLANNHIFDYGKEGIINTVSFLENNNLNHIGCGTDKNSINKFFYYEKNDISVCIINVAENGFGAAIESEYGYKYMNDQDIQTIISENKKKVDYIIIVCHAGAENFNLPLPEIRELYKKYSDWGADIIIGHHPHVPQGIEKYNQSVIVYSLGNFAFDIGNQNPNIKSYIINFSLEKNKINYNRIPILYSSGKVFLDNDSNYEDLDNALLSSDYMTKINEFCLDKYKEYKKMYKNVTISNYSGLKQSATTIIKKLVLRRKFEDKWLYHNISIETHYWICKRATRLILKEKEVL